MHFVDIVTILENTTRAVVNVTSTVNANYPVIDAVFT